MPGFGKFWWCVKVDIISAEEADLGANKAPERVGTREPDDAGAEDAKEEDDEPAAGAELASDEDADEEDILLLYPNTLFFLPMNELKSRRVRGRVNEVEQVRYWLEIRKIRT